MVNKPPSPLKVLTTSVNIFPHFLVACFSVYTLDLLGEWNFSSKIFLEDIMILCKVSQWVTIKKCFYFLSTVVLKLEVKNLFKMLFCFNFCDFNLIQNAEVIIIVWFYIIINVCLKTLFEASISFPWQSMMMVFICIFYSYAS